MAKKDHLTEELNRHFGFGTFKGNQKAIIENVLAGKVGGAPWVRGWTASIPWVANQLSRAASVPSPPQLLSPAVDMAPPTLPVSTFSTIWKGRVRSMKFFIRALTVPK